MVKQLLLFLCISATLNFGHSQDLGQIGKADLFTLTGGISASSVYYEGDAEREPLTYFINGNINLNISNVYNIPFSFSYSSQQFQNTNPFSFNRLSIHPSYKWITTHIGDVSMTFSPYTLSGHQFTGLGVDLAPMEGKLKVSAMGGRLLRKVEYDSLQPRAIPAYERFGYGLKAGYDFERFSIAATVFKASDDPTSLAVPVPLELQLAPKENAVASLEGTVALFGKGSLRIEAASSAITEDTRPESEEENSFVLSSVLTSNATTQQYKAYNATISYPVAQGSIGAGYEYIDPNYRTFGAYYFNNDLENITVNAMQSIFGGTLTLGFDGGIQRDDLDNTKSSQLQRIVSSFTAAFTPSPKVSLSGGYSNFQSYTNIKDPFDRINETEVAQTLDTLDFQQISQNANLSLSYQLQETEHRRQNLALSGSYQNAVNRQGGQAVDGGTTDFYNGTSSYTFGLPKQHLTLTAAANASLSTVDTLRSTTFGPTFSVGKQFLDKRLRTTGSVGYNRSLAQTEIQAEVTNIRLSGQYTLRKKHNFNLNILAQQRKATLSSRNLTATFSYSYVFDALKAKGWAGRKKEKPTEIEFTYEGKSYRGTIREIDAQLKARQAHPDFATVPDAQQQQLTALREAALLEKSTDTYKAKALEFLEGLYGYQNFVKQYDETVFAILGELQYDMQRLDQAFENAYVKAKIAVDNHPLHALDDAARKKSRPEAQAEYAKRMKRHENALTRLASHRWMLPLIAKYETVTHVREADPHLKAVMQQEKEALYLMKAQGDSPQDMERYLIMKIIEQYENASREHLAPEALELKYAAIR